MPLDTSEAFAKAEECLKLLKVEVNAAVMPQHQKMFCREARNSHSSGPMKAARKKAEKAQADAASGAFEALAASNADGAVASRVDFGCDAKLWQKLQKSILAKKASGGSFLVCSAGSGKVGVYACVAKNHTLDAREWCAAAADAIGGGKGGGKERAANMVVLGGGDVDAAVAAAQAFAKGKGL